MTTSADRPGKTHDRAAVPMAILLWLMVVVALAYGVVQTLTQVVALFG
jgi:hypothetical protein